MKKVKLLPLTQMNEQQQLIYEYLRVGDRSFKLSVLRTKNLSRRKLVELLNVKDSNARRLIKSMLPYTPIVASEGYFIASSITEIDKYVQSLEAKILGIGETIAYLKEHRKQMVNINENIGLWV